MTPNILITGAAGYIGGSLITTFLTTYKKSEITAAVRSQEQADALASLGVKVLQLDLTDEEGVVECVVGHKFNIIINTASSLDPRPALNCVTALGKLGGETAFIHSSGLSAFLPATGWKDEGISDAGPIFEREKELADSFAIRKTDVDVTELAEKLGVKSCIVVPSLVFGRGTGLWNQLSVVIPPLIRGFITGKAAYRFEQSPQLAGVHISDLTALYLLLVHSIITNTGTPIPSGKKGYYIAIANTFTCPELVEGLAGALFKRGLIEEREPRIWPSDRFAAGLLGVPEGFVQIFWNSGCSIIAETAKSIGWKPVWDKEKFFEEIDSEVWDVIELGKAKSSLMDSLNGVAKN